MSKNRALRTQIVRLLFTPGAITAVLLAICFLVITGQFVRNEQQQRNEFVLTLFTGIQDQRTLDHALLNQLAVSLLGVEGFRSVALVDANEHVLWSRGLPLKPKIITKINARTQNDTTWCRSSQCFTRIPIRSGVKIAINDRSFRNGNNSIIVVTSNLRFAILSYNALIAVAVTLGICVALAWFFARRFRDEITRPLTTISNGIQKYLQGKFEDPISNKDGKHYNNLVNGVNELATQLKGAQENLQSSVEQTTAELRETLETVEIQNIELDIARKAAIQASKVKSEFLANTSHEIRTPLNGILGFSELLKKTELNHQQEEYLETIYESAKGLLTIINDILDFSRLEIGKLTLEYKPVRLRQVIEESLRLQAPAAHEKKLRLLTVIDHDIPEHLLGDPLRLKQVLTNLLSNAIKFTHVGHILISISKEDRDDNQITLQFRITDSGIGLNQDQQEQLFDAFTQLDSSDSRSHGGTGLGLAIAKGLVDRMNGQIGVESEPGKGATFWFTSILGKNPNAANSAGYLTGTLRNVRAIVYDCSSMSRAEITHYIRGWGAVVNEISNFDDIEAKTEEACRSGQIHLAILDAQADDKSFDKIRLRKIIDVLNRDYSIPVVVLAAPALERLISPELAGSHSTIITRPVFCNRLHQVVCEQLGIIIPQTDRESSPAISEVPEQDIRILAVDDNPANLRLVTELLKDLHVEVIAVDNGADALRLAEAEHFDLILMDIQMPGMDGMEATKKLRSLESVNVRTPVVALTAHAANEQKSKFLLAGMDDYLTKPVSENELRHIIDRWVTRNPFTQKLNLEKASRIGEQSDDPASKTNTTPGTASSSQTKLVDIALSLSLAKNKPDLASDMLTMLIHSLPEAKNDIAGYLNEGNYKGLQEVIHKLHGGCCYCGVPRLKKTSAELDDNLKHALEKNERLSNLEERVTRLLTIIDDLLAWNEEVSISDLFEPDEHAHG